MSGIDLNHTSVSTLFKRTIQGPYDGGGYLRTQFYGTDREELDALEFISKMSAPIHGQKVLVGYVLNQVGLNRSTLEHESLAYVEEMEGKPLMELVEDEGGSIVRVGTQMHRRGRRDLMLLGRHIIEWDWGDQPRGQDWAPDAGPLHVHQFRTTEEAQQQLQATVTAYDAFQKANAALRESMSARPISI